MNIRNITVKLLTSCERLYLYAHGWKSVGHDKYVPPKDYPLARKVDQYTRSHAVNAQRQVRPKT